MARAREHREAPGTKNGQPDKKRRADRQIDKLVNDIKLPWLHAALHDVIRPMEYMMLLELAAYFCERFRRLQEMDWFEGFCNTEISTYQGSLASQICPSLHGRAQKEVQDVQLEQCMIRIYK